MRLLSLLALVGLSAADLLNCRSDLGNQNGWLGYDIIGSEILEIAHQNQPQGDNFCWGDDEAGNLQVQFYVDVTCELPPHEPPNPDPQPDKKYLPPCGDIDSEVTYCPDNQLRAAANLVATTTSSAAELAYRLKAVIAPRNWAIHVAKVAGGGELLIQSYTDKNVCIVVEDDLSPGPDAQWVIAIIKLDDLPQSGPEKNSARRGPSALDVKRKMLKKFAISKAPKDEEEIGTKCRYDMEEFEGWWNSFVASGLVKAARVGDSLIGENSCIDERRAEGRFDLGYYVNSDLECDDVPAKTTGVKRLRRRLVKVDGPSAKELPLQCTLDMEAFMCMDLELREHLKLVIQENDDNDVYKIAKQTESYVNTARYNILVAAMQEHSEVMRSARTDLQFCSVVATNKNDVDIYVQVSKLEFYLPYP